MNTAFYYAVFFVINYFEYNKGIVHYSKVDNMFLMFNYSYKLTALAIEWYV